VIETVLKASTPLEDLGDVEALDSHLRNMAYKSEISMQEIKRLNEELRGIFYWAMMIYLWVVSLPCMIHRILTSILTLTAYRQ